MIYPLYQDDIRTPPREFTRHALIGTRRAYEMLRLPGHVAADQRGLGSWGIRWARMFSDDHGTPALTADHRMVSAPGGMVESTGESPWVQRSATRPRSASAQDDDDDGRGEVVTNALDFYGTWKLFDGLADTVFRGMHREYALGNTPQQRYMGEWSDHLPVRELMIGLP